MTPGPNTEAHVATIHTLQQSSVDTSRQVSQDSDTTNSYKDEIDSIKTPKNPDSSEISDQDSQACIVTPTEKGDLDHEMAVVNPSQYIETLPPTSNVPVVGETISISNTQSKTDEVVGQAACPSTKSSSIQIPQSASSAPLVSEDSDNTKSDGSCEGIVDSRTAKSPPTIISHGIEDQPSPTTTVAAGTKRKIPSEENTSLSPTDGSPSSNASMIRRDSLPMGLRNKKMKATDCLLFAATLLEQDAAEALVSAGTSISATNNTPSLITSSFTSTNQAEASFVPAAMPSPPIKKTKPFKKMVCEKIERALQEVALQKKLQGKNESEQGLENGDCENKPKDADVLCGRGGKVNKHPGNIVYRKVVEYNKSYYQSVHKKHRILVSQSIVRAILNYGGRFMGQKGKDWTPICFKRAVQKTSQALRERSNTSDAVIHGAVGESNQSKQQIVVK